MAKQIFPKIDFSKLPKLKFPALKMPAGKPAVPFFSGGKFRLAPNFFKKKILVMEIGDQWLKMAGACEDRKVLTAEWAAAEKIADQQDPGVSLKLLQALKVHSFKPDKILISYPSQYLTIRMLSLPATDLQEIHDIVDLQAVKQTPYSREEITTGYHVIESDETGYSRVFLAISHRDQVLRYFRIGELARLLADQAVPSLEGLRAWYATHVARTPVDTGDVTLLLELDATHTHLLIMNVNKLVFSRSIEIGASHLKEQGAAAESDLIREVSRSIESGIADRKIERVTRMVLTGVDESLKNAAAVLTRELNLPCEVVGGFDVLGAKPRFSGEGEGQVSWASIAGLLTPAAHGLINLMPPEIKVRKTLEERARDLAWFGTLMLSLVMTLSLIGFEKIYKRNAYLGYLKKEYASLRPEAEDMEKVIEKMKLAKDQIESGGSFLDVLKDLSTVLPESITLTSIQFQDRDKNLVIRGVTEEMSAVFQFLTTLESTPYLESVKTRNVTKRRVGERELSEFEIAASVTAGAETPMPAPGTGGAL